jgi:hypothetical protein
MDVFLSYVLIAMLAVICVAPFARIFQRTGRSRVGGTGRMSARPRSVHENDDDDIEWLRKRKPKKCQWLKRMIWKTSLLGLMPT